MTGTSDDQDLDGRIEGTLEAFAAGDVELGDVATRIQDWLIGGSVTRDAVDRVLRDAARRGSLTEEAYRRLASLTEHTASAEEPLVSAETLMRKETVPLSTQPAHTKYRASTGTPQDSTYPSVPDAQAAGEREVPASAGSVLKGQYRLERQLGVGGMGIVYLARDLEHERVAQEEQFVAVKVLRSEYRQQPDLVRALFEEVRKTKELAHPNIVSVFNCQQDGPDVFVTMQYLEGMTLDRLLDQGFARGLPWDRARAIIEGIGRGLAHAHDNGVIHCDLKPSNVFITLSGTVKLLDFGIARATRGVRGQRFDTGTLHGLTVEYACPEAIRAWRDDNSDAWSKYRPTVCDDIYSFGCVVYEMLTGERPFSADDAELARQKSSTCAPIRGLSRRQNNAISHALAFDRDRRTNRVEDFLQALRLTPGARPLLETINRAVSVSGGRPGSGLRGIVVIAATLAVAAIGVGLFRSNAFDRGRQSPAATAPAPSVQSSPRAGAPTPLPIVAESPNQSAAADPASIACGPGTNDERMIRALESGRRRAALIVKGNAPNGAQLDNLEALVRANDCVTALAARGVVSPEAEKFRHDIEELLSNNSTRRSAPKLPPLATAVTNSAPAVPKDSSHKRCDSILERAQLGESLSEEEQSYIAQKCQ